MIRQTLFAGLAFAVVSTLSPAAQAKTTTYDCELDRRIVLGGKVRGNDRVQEVLHIDLVGKTMTVGKKTGDYAIMKLNEASMTGLPPRDKVTFDLADGTLRTFSVSVFGEVVRRSGKCVPRTK